jgi:hypothetical protein
MTDVAKTVIAGVEFACFWTAVCLPIGYLAVLYHGLTGREFGILIGLLGLHSLTFVLGRGYSGGTGYGGSSPNRDHDRSV